jgi:SSS family solute:Na+ symporter
VSSQAGSFIGASAAFVVGIAVSALVTMFTTSKPDSELVGLVWSLTPRRGRGQVVVEGAGVGGGEPVGTRAAGGGDPAAERRAVGVPAGIGGPGDEDEGAWWQSPVVLGVLVLALTLALYLIFW